MFYRKIQDKIIEYLQGKEQKILVIDGARQIGKSFIIREICQNYYDNYIEINLAKDFYEGDRIYEKIKNPKDLYLQISANYGSKMIDWNKTIIFLDEIQVYPHLLSMLKSLKEDGKYRFIASGSELGITLKKTFIPMGAIDEIKMYPMDFEEFLLANDVSSDVIVYMKKCFEKRIALDESLHETILKLFKMYLLVGGLPDAVKAYVNDNNIEHVRQVHKMIYENYMEDASKYDKENKLKIVRMYELMISYMENKVKRIKLNDIENKTQARYEKYQNEFDYLISSGIALGVMAISEPKFPLVQSVSKNLIKLYYNDVGILSYILFQNNINGILEDTMHINLGSIYETVVAQELKAHGHDLFYYDRRKEGEVDYLLSDYDNLCPLPIEIKSGRDGFVYSALTKMLKNEQYNIAKGYVFSNNRKITIKNKIIELPIYYIMFV